MLKHVARVREVVRAIFGGHVLAVEHRRLGDLRSPGRHLDSSGRDVEADAPLAEATAPELRQHPAVTAPDVRDRARQGIIPYRGREMGRCARPLRSPTARASGRSARRPRSARRRPGRRPRCPPRPAAPATASGSGRRARPLERALHPGVEVGICAVHPSSSRARETSSALRWTRRGAPARTRARNRPVASRRAQRGEDVEHRALAAGADVVAAGRLRVRGGGEVRRDDVADVDVVARLRPSPKTTARRRRAAGRRRSR